MPMFRTAVAVRQTVIITLDVEAADAEEAFEVALADGEALALAGAIDGEPMVDDVEVLDVELI